MTKSLPIVAAALAATMFSATAATAGVAIADYNADGVWTSYDASTSTYGMKFADDGSKDGFWLVVSDGPNPKENATEYAILYGDREANRITAYTYDGENSANSYQNGTLLGSYEGVFSPAGTHVASGAELTMFTLDVAELNGALTNEGWDGVQFGEQAGIWFHQSAGSDFEYGEDGSILDYSFTDQMFVDGAFKTTYMLDCATRPGVTACGTGTTITNTGGGTGGGSVPAPGGLSLLLAGLIGLRFRKKA